MGYVTSYRDATRTVTSTNTGTRTAYRTAYETREQDIGFDRIPVIRPNFTYFSFSGLRPNTPHWVFFDGKNVTKWVNTSYNAADYNNLERNDPIRIPGEKYIDSTAFPTDLGGPTAASGPVYTDASGNLDGLFYIQSNSALSFPTGNRTMAVLDISVLNKAESLSFAQAEYSAIGEYELYYQYQHEYQEAYTETYSYTTSYTETYTEAYDTWVDDPVTTTTTTTTAPVDETPVVTTTATNSGATTNTSSDDGGSTNMTLVYNPNDGYNYYTTESHADIMVEHQGWTDKGSGNDDATNGSNNSDCVIATYANSIGSDLLNSREKRKAEIWCLRTFHDKWWGEAIRKGYRYLGRKAIAKGVADKHFQEFIDYVNFGSGKQRSVKSGLNFVYRTIQFISYGLTVARREK